MTCSHKTIKTSQKHTLKTTIINTLNKRMKKYEVFYNRSTRCHAFPT